VIHFYHPIFKTANATDSEISRAPACRCCAAVRVVGWGEGEAGRCTCAENCPTYEMVYSLSLYCVARPCSACSIRPLVGQWCMSRKVSTTWRSSVLLAILGPKQHNGNVISLQNIHVKKLNMLYLIPQSIQFYILPTHSLYIVHKLNSWCGGPVISPSELVTCEIIERVWRNLVSESILRGLKINVSIPSILNTGARRSIVVKALYYKPEGRRFETRWGEWFLSTYLILPAALGTGVYSASNRNEY
jgi:hypothetical protein